MQQPAIEPFTGGENCWSLAIKKNPDPNPLMEACVAKKLSMWSLGSSLALLSLP